MTGLVLAGAVVCVLGAVALRRGDWPERMVAVAMAGAVVAAPLIALHPLGRLPHFGLFLVDTALLTVVTGVALRSDRWWPLFCCAFVLVAAISGLALAFDGGLERLGALVGPLFWNGLAAGSLAAGLWAAPPAGPRSV